MSASTLTALKIMTYRRGVGSRGLAAFIERLRSELTSTGYMHEADEFGNIWLTTDANSRTLFTAHTDSVHSADAPVAQEVLYDSALRCAFKEDGAPLGADDGIGIWLLLEMIYANVPGTYVFYHGEERGGIGSSASAKAHEAIYKGFDRAIALDRAGTTDVITHQAWGRCCSDTFANALAEALGGSYTPCNAGVFTDTANLVDLIPECTNLSVGYENQHTQHETQDFEFAEDILLPALLAIDWETLPTERDPADNFADQEYFAGYDLYGSTWNHGERTNRARAEDIAHDTVYECMELTDTELALLVDYDPDAALTVMQTMRDTLIAIMETQGV